MREKDWAFYNAVNTIMFINKRHKGGFEMSNWQKTKDRCVKCHQLTEVKGQQERCPSCNWIYDNLLHKRIAKHEGSW